MKYFIGTNGALAVPPIQMIDVNRLPARLKSWVNVEPSIVRMQFVLPDTG